MVWAAQLCAGPSNGPRRAPRHCSPTRTRAITTPPLAWGSIAMADRRDADRHAGGARRLSQQLAPSIPGNSYPQTVTGLYKTPNLHLRVRGVYTNTVPVDAYRGSGRPEATWTNERLIERGARELGIDTVEIGGAISSRAPIFRIPRRVDACTIPAIRRRCSTAAGGGGLRRAAARAGQCAEQGTPDGHWPRRLHRQGGHRAEPNLAKRGGLHGGWESAIVRVHSDGKVTISRVVIRMAGTRDHLCQIAADRLGFRSRTSAWSKGIPTKFRSATVPGERARPPLRDGDLSCRRQGARQGPALRGPGARMREDDIDYARGNFTVRGTDGRSASPRSPTLPTRCAAAARQLARPRSYRVLRSA